MKSPTCLLLIWISFNFILGFSFQRVFFELTLWSLKLDGLHVGSLGCETSETLPSGSLNCLRGKSISEAHLLTP